jgi:2-polyprenyl-3-methyl-5-hydroxy-6-metoxy-1,4-benzoquinol methylase
MKPPHQTACSSASRLIPSSSAPPSTPRAEFDAYAQDYTAGMEDPIKRLMGGTFEAFIDLKARYLMRDLGRRRLRSVTQVSAARLLDFGCGSGELLQSLRRHGFTGELHGCDVSTAMLAEAARRWCYGPSPMLYAVGTGELPFTESSLDLVTVCCVLHHVPLAKHSAVLARLVGLLKPAGRIVVFEHNPLNPITRHIVRRAPIDRNAVLVSAASVQRELAAAGMIDVRTRFILFFPPRFPQLARIESLLGWLPLGGQYIVVGEKPCTTAP